MTRRSICRLTLVLIVTVALTAVRVWPERGHLPAAADRAGPSAAKPDTRGDGQVRTQSSARPRITEPRACGPAVEACVDLSSGLAWLQRDGRITHGPFAMRDGTRADPTPIGKYRVSWKDRHHTSSIYGLPMPYAVFFAVGGIAFHQGPIDEASHGCIHLRPRVAELFFDRLGRGDVVRVRG